jgi:alpha-beta hydrolase superfamily lysophospholipase
MPRPVINLLIHGIGNQSPDWHDEATQGLHHKYAPFYWEDIRDQVQQSHVSVIRKPWRYLARVIPAYDAVLDVLTADDTLAQAMARLDYVIQCYWAQGCDVVLHAHSLGSVLAYLYLQHYAPDTVVRLITYGSPLGRWPVSHKVKQSLRVKAHQPLPSLSVPWVNVTNKKDYVTSWLGNGKIKEADADLESYHVGHDLKAYLSWVEVFQPHLLK